MTTRRQFLSHGALAMLGAAGSAFALPSETRESAIPDGSASKDMITPEADAAIARGLAYLYSQQNKEDGSFGVRPYQGNVAITSLAALAFMAGGHQPGRGAYGNVVTRALEAVLTCGERSNRKGYLHNISGTPHGPMYGHGFGTLFLAEVTGMVQDPVLRDRLKRMLRDSVDLIIHSQNAEGGWRYYPDSVDADLSVTICQIMALRAARNAGLLIEKSVVDRCVQYVKACQDRREGWFRYQKQGGGMGFGNDNQAFARTAAGVCALYSAGIYEGPEINTGLEYLKKTRSSRFVGQDFHYFYGHYYAVQAMWTAGGSYWSEWFPWIRDELVNRQKVSNTSPSGGWHDQICVHYGTAMACLILQIPNNYLPIFQK
jgi:hypothetical protein